MNVFITSCIDDHRDLEKPSNKIGFTVKSQSEEDATSTTKGEGEKDNASSFTPQILSLDNASKEPSGMYLHISEIDGIETHVSEEKGGTRAAPITASNFYDSFGVFAYIYPASESWNNSQTPNFMNNIEITKSSGWTTDYYWPGINKKVAFFAYAPYRNINISFPSFFFGAPTFSYTVPTQVKEQKDLLAVDKVDLIGNGAGNTPVDLTFKHILTAVKFEVRDILPGTIKKISLKNIIRTAKYTIGGAGWKSHEHYPLWEYSQDMNFSVDGTPNVPITDGETTFMMIPQTLPAGAKIEVIFVDDLTHTEHTLSASIEGQSWPIGKTVMYRISKSSILLEEVFSVTGPENSFLHTGGDQAYTVKSYSKKYQAGSGSNYVYTPMAWTSKFFTVEGTDTTWLPIKPIWVTNFTESISGGEDFLEEPNSEYSMTVNAQNDKVILWDNKLKDAPAIGSEGAPYDLSTLGGTNSMNTANCYLVNAPGVYQFPLVYGNAIKNGNDNMSAYYRNTEGKYVLKNFVNHDDVGIQGPYINFINQAYPDHPYLVWENVSGLISNHSLVYNVDGVRCLKFEVKRENIKQGNAVVAVRDNSNTILWSWHIWVTPYKLGEEIQTFGDGTYNYTILPYSIGYYNPMEGYVARSVKVKITQTDTGKTADFEIKQKGYNTDLKEEKRKTCYYQFGRKDPFFLNDGSNLYYYLGSGPQSIGSAIKDPDIFITRKFGSAENDWLKDAYWNLWNMNQNKSLDERDKDLGLKTIYDPSPVGYKVPPAGIWYFAKGGYMNFGYIFFNGIYYSDKGHRYCSSTVRGGTARAVYVLENSENVIWNYKSHGCAVRPIKEKP